MRLTYKRWIKAQVLMVRIRDHYGRPSWEITPPVIVLYHNRKGKSVGWMFPRALGINFALCDSWRDVVETGIEEYSHYLQKPTRTDKKRYEREARKVVARDLHLFWKPKK